jgi:hypothetical protein
MAFCGGVTFCPRVAKSPSGEREDIDRTCGAKFRLKLEMHFCNGKRLELLRYRLEFLGMGLG